MSGSHRAARNVFVTLVTQALMWSLSFTTTLYVPGYLKDTGLGVITLTGSFATIFSVLVGLGTSRVLIKDIARNHECVGELFVSSLLMRLGLGVVATLGGWMAAYLLKYPLDLQLLVVLSLIIMVVGQVGDVFTSILAGLEEFPRQNVTFLVERVLFGVLTIGLVLFHRPLWEFIGVGLLSSLGLVFSSIYFLRTRLSRLPRPQWSTIRSLAQAGMPFVMVGVFTAVYGQSDALLLSKMSGVAAIGWYSLAKRLGGTTMVIPVALSSTMLPTLSRMHQESASGFAMAVRRLINLMMICVIPFSAVLMLAPGQILSLLHYPASYRHSIPVLILAGGAIILWYLSQAVGTALIACDRQAVFSRITGIAALISVPLCALSIFVTERTMHNGAIGAMFSDAALELIMVIAYMRALPEGVFEWRIFSVLARTTIAALPFALSLYTMHSKRDVVLPLLCLVIYGAACIWMRCLYPQDVNALRQTLRRFSRA